MNAHDYVVIGSVLSVLILLAILAAIGIGSLVGAAEDLIKSEPHYTTNREPYSKRFSHISRMFRQG